MSKLLSSISSRSDDSVEVRSSVFINHLDESFIIPASVGSMNCGSCHFFVTQMLYHFENIFFSTSNRVITTSDRT